MATATARTFFTLWVLLCLGCSSVGSSDPNEPAVSKREEAAMEPEKLATTKEITEGTFRALTIGDSKNQVLVALRKMGATRIEIGLGEQVAVTRAEDLSKLREAGGIIIGAGDVTIIFDGNDVRRITVAPVFPEWNTLLHGVRTRQETFRVLAQILEQSKDVEMRALPVDADHVWIDFITPESQALLDKYDHWSIAHDAEDMFLHMDLDFTHGSLRRISVLESPAAL